jgi:glycosidase
MDRFLYIVGGDKAALRRAAALLFELPGPPVIYYGTEVGLAQTHSKGGQLGLEAGRVPMEWQASHQDRALFDFFRGLIRARAAAKPWLR